MMAGLCASAGTLRKWYAVAEDSAARLSQAFSQRQHRSKKTACLAAELTDNHCQLQPGQPAATHGLFSHHTCGPSWPHQQWSQLQPLATAAPSSILCLCCADDSLPLQQVCKLPTILAHPWFERLVGDSPSRLVSKSAFMQWWLSRGLVSAPPSRRLWEVLRPEGRHHLTYADFRPLLQVRWECGICVLCVWTANGEKSRG